MKQILKNLLIIFALVSSFVSADLQKMLIVPMAMLIFAGVFAWYASPKEPQRQRMIKKEKIVIVFTSA